MKRLAMLVCGLLAISLSGCQTNANRPGIFKNGT
jgi:outer membrane lipoprotein SlyB